jgi:membrane-associated phospholipid phosphatase
VSRDAVQALSARLILGALALLVATVAFALVADAVFRGQALPQLDQALALWFHRHLRPDWTRGMLVVAAWHSQAGILVMAALLALHFYCRRARAWLLATGLVVPGGMILNVLLKFAFARARPHFADPLLTLETYSFPSGHAAGATLFYGLLACYLLRQTRTWPPRLAIVGMALAMVALVCLCRIYLGVHYLSDVLAGVLAASAWLTMCLTAVAAWQQGIRKESG